MIDKDRYIALLNKALTEHYSAAKETGIVSKESQQYIDGYMTAARALGVFGYDELKEIVDKVHFDAFGKTIEERRRSEVMESATEEDLLDIPAYIRHGIALSKG